MTPDTSNTLSIPVSKTKLALSVLGAIVMAALCFWVWTFADRQERLPPPLLKGVTIAGMLLFPLCAVFAFWKLTDARPGLVLDSRGITDNSSGVAAGFIPWDQITAVKIGTIKGQRFLTIEVADPQAFIARSGLLRRLVHTMNMRLCGSPINISSNSLKIGFDELYDHVREFRAKYGGGPRGR
jgi:hypothetical protein